MGYVEVIDGHKVAIEKLDCTSTNLAELSRQLGLAVPVSSGSRPRSGHVRAQEPFLRGPIPLRWLQCASQLPGKALHVGLVLWYLAGLSGALTVTLTRTKLQQFGVHHETGRRALLALEHAKLVQVERHGKRSPRVTLLATAFRREISRQPSTDPST
jgi:hypothetical protein